MVQETKDFRVTSIALLIPPDLDNIVECVEQEEHFWPGVAGGVAAGLSVLVYTVFVFYWSSLTVMSTKL